MKNIVTGVWQSLSLGILLYSFTASVALAASSLSYLDAFNSVQNPELVLSPSQKRKHFPDLPSYLDTFEPQSGDVVNQSLQLALVIARSELRVIAKHWGYGPLVWASEQLDYLPEQQTIIDFLNSQVSEPRTTWTIKSLPDFLPAQLYPGPELLEQSWITERARGLPELRIIFRYFSLNFPLTKFVANYPLGNTYSLMNCTIKKAIGLKT